MNPILRKSNRPRDHAARTARSQDRSLCHRIFFDVNVYCQRYNSSLRPCRVKQFTLIDVNHYLAESTFSICQPLQNFLQPMTLGTHRRVIDSFITRLETIVRRFGSLRCWRCCTWLAFCFSESTSSGMSSVGMTG
jgi:hypothetical protein